MSYQGQGVRPCSPLESASPCCGGFHNLGDDCLSSHPSFLLSTGTHCFQRGPPYPRPSPMHQQQSSSVYPDQVRVHASCAGHTNRLQSWWEDWDTQPQTPESVDRETHSVTKVCPINGS